MVWNCIVRWRRVRIWPRSLGVHGRNLYRLADQRCTIGAVVGGREGTQNHVVRDGKMCDLAARPEILGERDLTLEMAGMRIASARFMRSGYPPDRSAYVFNGLVP